MTVAVARLGTTVRGGRGRGVTVAVAGHDGGGMGAGWHEKSPGGNPRGLQCPALAGGQSSSFFSPARLRAAPRMSPSEAPESDEP